MLTANLFAPPAIAALALALLSVLMLLASGVRNHWATWGTHMRVRMGVLLLSIAMFLLLAAAAANPRWVQVQPDSSLHIVLAVDVSNSVLRGPGGWDAVRQTLIERVDRVQQTLDDQPSAATLNLTTSLVTFAAGAESQSTGDLSGLRRALLQLEPALSDAGSNLAAGLDRGREAVAAAGGQGMVLLVSDGYATIGDSAAAARRLGANGVPLYIWPVSGSGPATAIAAGYVAQMVEAGVDIQARLLLANGGLPASNEVSVQVNPSLSVGQRFGQAVSLTYTVAMDAQQRVSLRAPLRFTGAGMQLVELALHTQQGAQERRRFYVQVKQPPKILAIGDSQWAAALPQNVAQVVTQTAANFDGAADLVGVDAVVISGVPATDFQPPALAQLAKAVTQEGLGLFVINGAHTEQDPKTPTVLMSYNETPIEPLLPISTRPRPMLEEPPPLHIFILIDTSGSMADAYKPTIAKDIARHLIEKQMRPQDRLDLLTFTTSASHLVVDSPMNAAKKRTALALVDSLQMGGGTNIGPALDAIAGGALGECGLIIITDLEFDVARQRPECKATVFAVGANAQAGSPLEAFAEPFYVGADFQPAGIKLSIYNPQPRDKFFEPGQYQALSAEHQTKAGSRLPVPALPLYGNAIGYVVENAELVAVRPRITDPVLAYKRNGSGYVGAFTTGLPAEWLGDVSSREAISAWLQRVLPFVAQNRYNITLDNAGDRLLVRVELTGEDGALPAVDSMSLAAEFAGGEIVNANLEPDREAVGAFIGGLNLPPQTSGALGFLVITEDGPEALPRPQRVPFTAPPQSDADGGLMQEDYSFGVNRAALGQLAAAGGGAIVEAGVENQPLPIVLRPQTPERSFPLWPALLVAGLACLVVAVALPRWLP